MLNYHQTNIKISAELFINIKKMVILETEQIHNLISRKIQSAHYQITVCVAWFTSKPLSTVVKDRLKTVKVNILISDHEFNNKASHFNMLLRYQN